MLRPQHTAPALPRGPSGGGSDPRPRPALRRCRPARAVPHGAGALPAASRAPTPALSHAAPPEAGTPRSPRPGPRFLAVPGPARTHHGRGHGAARREGAGSARLCRFRPRVPRPKRSAAVRPEPSGCKPAPAANPLRLRAGLSFHDRSHHLSNHCCCEGWQVGWFCDAPQPARCSWKRSIPAPKIQLTAEASAALIPSRTESTQHCSFQAAKAASAKAV